MKINAINYQPQAVFSRVQKQKNEQTPIQSQAIGSMFAKSYTNITFSANKPQLISKRIKGSLGTPDKKMFFDAITGKVLQIFEYKPNRKFLKKTTYSENQTKIINYFEDINKVKSVHTDHIEARPVSEYQKSANITKTEGSENIKTEPVITKSTTIEFNKDNSRVVTVEHFDNPQNILKATSQEKFVYDKTGKLIEKI